MTCLTWFLFCHKRYQCTLLVMKKIHQWKQVGPQAICYLLYIKGYHAIFLSFCFAWIAIIILNGLTWKLKYMYGCKRCYEYLRSLDSPGGHHRKHVCIVLFQDWCLSKNKKCWKQQGLNNGDVMDENIKECCWLCCWQVKNNLHQIGSFPYFQKVAAAVAQRCQVSWTEITVQHNTLERKSE